MPLPKVGNGYQFGDGNLSEPKLITLHPPAAATATATLTPNQLVSGILVANPSTTAATYTLPTVANLEALELDNAKVGTGFELVVVNLGTGSGAVTFAVGAGWAIVGAAVVAIGTSARFLARKMTPTTWTLYRAA